jgi:DNA primase
MLENKFQFLEKFLGKGKFYKAQKEGVFYCPFCKHHKPKLSVNLETNQFHCWVCNKGGKRLDHLIKNNASSDDIREYRKSFHLEDKEILEREKAHQEELANYKISLPKDYVFLLDYKDSILGSKAYKYLIERGITDEDILRHKIGYSVTDDKYKGRIILPSFSAAGELNFFCARLVDKNDQKLKYDAEHTPRGYLKSIILNELNIDFTKPLTIVEGFIDMLKANENTVPLFSNYLREDTKLFNEIVKNRTQVFLALDRDATSNALRIARHLIAYDVECFFVDVFPFKDVGEMTKEKFLSHLEKAEKIDEETLFLNKVKDLC